MIASPRFLLLFLLTAPFASAQIANPVNLGSISGPDDGVHGDPLQINIADKYRIDLSGYIQIRFTDETGSNNQFQVKRLRLEADTEFSDKVDLFVQVDPTLSPNVLLDGYLRWRPSRALRLQVGQFKVPFSGESLVSDERTISIERSLVVNSFSPGRDSGSQGRDLGAEATGNIGGKKGASLEYQVAVLNGNGIYNVNSNRQKAGSGRVILHPWAGISVGADCYQGKEPVSSTSNALVIKQRQDLEAGYKIGHFTSWAEYLWGHDGAIHRSGGYVLGGYRFNKHWEGFARAEDYDAYRLKRGNISRLYETGGNYYFTNLARFQANYGVRKDPVSGHLSQVALVQVQAEF